MEIYKTDGETFHICQFCEDEFKAKEYLYNKIMNNIFSGSNDD
jgi:hypothetical protein